MPSERVEQRRESVKQEIKKAAQVLMAQQGTGGLSLRAIAREIKMLPSGLYHYYPSQDDLITDLIADAFSALADAMEAARADAEALPYRDQLAAVLLAYREWAVTHPVDFQLIYGNPIPGYTAPREITLPPVIRGFRVIVGLIEAMLQTGEAVPAPPYNHIPPETRAYVQAQIESGGYPVSEQAMYLGVVGWTSLHGIIMLELYNHLQPVVGDTGIYYRDQIQNLFQVFGVK